MTFLVSVEMIMWFFPVFVKSELGISPRLSLKYQGWTGSTPRCRLCSLLEHCFLLFKTILMKVTSRRAKEDFWWKGWNKGLKSRRLEVTFKPKIGLHFCHRVGMPKPPNSITEDRMFFILTYLTRI